MKHYLREIRCEGLDTSRECFAIQELLTLHYANFPPYLPRCPHRLSTSLWKTCDVRKFLTTFRMNLAFPFS